MNDQPSSRKKKLLKDFSYLVILPVTITIVVYLLGKFFLDGAHVQPEYRSLVKLIPIVFLLLIIWIIRGITDFVKSILRKN
jgi:hypothetical protein